MDISTLIMMAVALLLLLAVYLKAPELAGNGLRASIALILEITPRMIAAFMIAGLIQVAVPHEIIAHSMGKESGSKGIFHRHGPGDFDPGRTYDAVSHHCFPLQVRDWNRGPWSPI
jgi:hypothetical protein